MSDKRTDGGATGSLAALLADSEGVVRQPDGQDRKRVAKPSSRLCLSVKERDRVRIGPNIEVIPYRHGGMIRLIIKAPRELKIERIVRKTK